MAMTCEQGLEACTHLQCGQKDVEKSSYIKRQHGRVTRTSESVTRLPGFRSCLLPVTSFFLLCGLDNNLPLP